MGELSRPTRPPRSSIRWLAVGAALTSVVLLASCASTPGGQPQAAPATTVVTHSEHPPFTAPPAQPLRAGERFVNLTMAKPYAPAAPHGGTDEYRCFLVDPQLNSAAFLTGSQFLPQNSELVHHAIFFRLGPAGAAEAVKVDAESPGDGWTCFGDSGIGDDAWVAHWAPGANETLLVPGIGYPMPAGSKLVMQVHYNLLATDGKAGGTDQSAIRLRLTDGKTALRPLETGQVYAPIELPCTAAESGPLCDRSAAVADVTSRFGEHAGQTVEELNEACNQGRAPVAGNTQHCDNPVDGAGTVYAVAGHMHLLGRSIKLELNPGTPGAQTLLDLPSYNFDDQAIRPLAKPVAVKAGDTLRVTCTHDAAVRKMLPQLSTLPARYVVWGDGTSDEMCLGLVIWTRSA